MENYLLVIVMYDSNESFYLYLQKSLILFNKFLFERNLVIFSMPPSQTKYTYLDIMPNNYDFIVFFSQYFVVNFAIVVFAKLHFDSFVKNNIFAFRLFDLNYTVYV